MSSKIRNRRIIAARTAAFAAFLTLAACGGGGGGSSSNTGGGTKSAATFFLPLVASPIQGSGGGTSGLFVITSTSLGSAPARVTPEAAPGVEYASIGYTQQLSISPSGTITSGKFNALVYDTLGAAAGDHIWALDLSATSNLVPRQVSNLLIPSGGNFFCSSFEGFDNLADPSSAFFVFGMCSGSYVLIHLNDTATTAPTNLPTFAAAVILPLYQPNGMLGGLLAIDSSNNLNFYADASFTNPTLLLQSVSAFSVLQAPGFPFIRTLSATPTYAFLVVTSKGLNSLYRVDYTGAISADLYDFQFALGTYGSDSNNIYFTDTVGVSNPEYICQAPLDGSSSALILYNAGNSPTFYTYAGSTGALLILQGVPTASGVISPEVDSLPIGLPGTPTTLATFSNPIETQIGTATSAGDVFVTVVTSFQYATFPEAIAYSSEILTATGTVLQPLTNQSFVLTPFYSSSLNPLLQVKGIVGNSTFGDGDISGGHLYSVDLNLPASPTATPVHLANGAPFVLPNGTTNIVIQSISSDFGFGYGTRRLSSISGSTQQTFGLAYDVSMSQMTMIAMPNTDISPL